MQVRLSLTLSLVPQAEGPRGQIRMPDLNPRQAGLAISLASSCISLCRLEF